MVGDATFDAVHCASFNSDQVTSQHPCNAGARIITCEVPHFSDNRLMMRTLWTAVAKTEAFQGRKKHLTLQFGNAVCVCASLSLLKFPRCNNSCCNESQVPTRLAGQKSDVQTCQNDAALDVFAAYGAGNALYVMNVMSVVYVVYVINLYNL